MEGLVGSQVSATQGAWVEIDAIGVLKLAIAAAAAALPAFVEI